MPNNTSSLDFPAVESSLVPLGEESAKPQLLHLSGSRGAARCQSSGGNRTPRGPKPPQRVLQGKSHSPHVTSLAVCQGCSSLHAGARRGAEEEQKESRRSIPHLRSCSPRGPAGRAPRLAQGSAEVLFLVAAEKMTG